MERESGDGFAILIRQYGPKLLAERYREEIEKAIEKAIDNAKRMQWDKQFRQQWYRAAAKRRRKKATEWPWKRRGHGGAKRLSRAERASHREHETSVMMPGYEKL